MIGDNPLVRWHYERQKCDGGINESGVEIVMPLGLNLCLKLVQQHSRHEGRLMECDEQQTRIYNDRQRIAAIKDVYGNSPEALRRHTAD